VSLQAAQAAGRSRLVGSPRRVRWSGAAADTASERSAVEFIARGSRQVRGYRSRRACGPPLITRGGAGGGLRQWLVDRVWHQDDAAAWCDFKCTSSRVGPGAPWSPRGGWAGGRWRLEI